MDEAAQRGRQDRPGQCRAGSKSAVMSERDGLTSGMGAARPSSTRRRKLPRCGYRGKVASHLPTHAMCGMPSR
eukprot:1405950-Rhodomonas_salina.2